MNIKVSYEAIFNIQVYIALTTEYGGFISGTINLIIGCFY